MFYDYELNPGWYFNAMLVLAKVKCTKSEEEYEEYARLFSDYLEAPTYLLIKPSKGLFIDDKDD